jgi:hypothetical protein
LGVTGDGPCRALARKGEEAVADLAFELVLRGGDVLGHQRYRGPGQGKVSD